MEYNVNRRKRNLNIAELEAVSGGCLSISCSHIDGGSDLFGSNNLYNSTFQTFNGGEGSRSGGRRPSTGNSDDGSLLIESLDYIGEVWDAILTEAQFLTLVGTGTALGEIGGPGGAIACALR